MKRIIAIISTLVLALSPAMVVQAADTSETDRLEVSAPANAKVGEAVDLTVKALSAAGEVVKNYTGTIYVIVENDNKATVPYAEGYTFTTADQGEKTFSKGLSFTKEGTFKVVVSDFDKPRIEGNVKVKVGAGSDTAPATGSEVVTITSPDNDSTLGGTTISVTGTTKKNSKVQLFINGEKAQDSQTTDSGSFAFQVKDVAQSQNVISVKVLDGTDAVVGESAKVNVSMASEGPVFKSLKLGGSGSTTSVSPGAKVLIEVAADAGLTEVSVLAGDNVAKLAETAPGTYTGDILAPMTAGSTSVDILLKSNLGATTNKTGAGTIEVTAATSKFKNVKMENGDKKVTFTFEVENPPADLKKFEITYMKEVDTTASGGMLGIPSPVRVLTYDKEKIMNGSGAYSWYVSNLDIAKYTFTISGVGADDKALGTLVSDSLEVDLSLGAAGKCMIANVGGLNLRKTADASYLSWDVIPEAVSYNVYKRNSEGKFVFIESVPSNSYTVHISTGPVTYEEFAVTAVCSDGTQSSGLSPSTRVQTGPAQLFLFFALALAAGYYLVQRKRIHN